MLSTGAVTPGPRSFCVLRTATRLEHPEHGWQGLGETSCTQSSQCRRRPTKRSLELPLLPSVRHHLRRDTPTKTELQLGPDTRTFAPPRAPDPSPESRREGRAVWFQGLPGQGEPHSVLAPAAGSPPNPFPQPRGLRGPPFHCPSRLGRLKLQCWGTRSKRLLRVPMVTKRLWAPTNCWPPAGPKVGPGCPSSSRGAGQRGWGRPQTLAALPLG